MIARRRMAAVIAIAIAVAAGCEVDVELRPSIDAVYQPDGQASPDAGAGAPDAPLGADGGLDASIH